MELPYEGLGVSMYVLAAVGGLFVLLSLTVRGLAILVLVAVGLLVVAVILNVVEDRRIDADARRRAVAWSAQLRAARPPPPPPPPRM